KDSKTKNSESFRKLQRTVFQQCLTILLKPILEGPELHFVVRHNAITFVPRISVILADMAEAYKFTNVYQPSTSKRPCGSCLILKDDLNNTELTNILPRTSYNMKQVISNGQAHENSIHTEHNIFWEIRDFNIYQVTVPDRMHILDLGLFKYMLDYTKELLNEQCGSWAVQTIEQRLTEIPRFHGLKIMKNAFELT
ncbi:5890_t:CDS:2, partial [Ambispora gerdemannii]